MASNRSTFVAVDRPNIHGNTTGWNIGSGVIIQGKIDTPDPFVVNSLLSPAYYPNLVENYADQLDGQVSPPTQPIAASVEPPPPIISVESKPRPVTITSGNLTMAAGTTYNPILNGTAGAQSVILEDFSAPRTLGISDVISEDQVNPWQVNFVDDDPNQPIYYHSPGVLGLWDPAGIQQNGAGTVIIETGSPVGALFDANATAPLDVSGYNNVRLIARRGPDFANGVKEIALGIVDQDGTVDVYFFPTKTLEDQWAINPATFVTFEVNLLTPPIRFTSGDGIMNLSAITGWAAAGDLAFTDLKTSNPLSIEIDSIGFTKGPAASQFDVTGSVALGAGVSTLDPVSGGNFVSSVGQVFTIINNDSTDAVTGTFKDSAGNNLANGAFFTAHGKHFQISYTGGTGNDVTLTEVSANSAPVLDLDVANGASTGRSTSWTFGGGAVNLTNTDAIVTDSDDATLDSLTAELSPAQDHLQQVVTLTGAPAGGNFTLTYNGKTTAPIPYNATAAQVDAALEALSTIGAGNVTVVTDPNAQHVTGSAGGPWTITFANSLIPVQKLVGDSQQLPRRIVALRGAPTGGTFLLTYHSQTTVGPRLERFGRRCTNGLAGPQHDRRGQCAGHRLGGRTVDRDIPGRDRWPAGPDFLGRPGSRQPRPGNIPTLTGGSNPRADVVDVDQLSGGVGPLVRVTDGGVHPNDVLAATAVGNIAVAYNSTSGQLKMTGTDSKANYQTVLRSITYNSTAHPAAATRTVLITANDGLSKSNVTVATVSITSNAVPVLDLDGAGGTNNFAVTVTHTATANAIVDSDATITDGDNANMASASARVTAVHPHISQLVKFAKGPIAPSFAVPTGGTFTLRYAGQTTADIPYNATAAQLDTALEALSTIGAGNVTVTSPNATGAPWTVVFGGSLDTTNLSQLTANSTNVDGTSQLVSTQTTIVSTSDTQPHMTQTVTLTGASAGTYTLTFLGQTTAPIAFNALASAVQSAIGALVNVGSANVGVTGSAGGPYTVVFGGINSTIDMTQLGRLIPDSTALVGATTVVTEAEAGVEVYPGDQLFLANPSGLSQSYNGTTGVLTITGTASKATYETALRTLNYYSTAVSPPAASRLVKIAAKDQGLAETVDPYSTINIIANELPVADLNGDTTAGTGLTVTWSRVSGPVSLANPSFATVHDSDDTTLVSMRVTLSSLHSGDVLAATASGLISVSYNSGNGVLLMTGTDTLANYQTVLRTLTYNNTSGISPPVANKLVYVSGDDGNGTALNSFDTIVITANQKPLLDLDAGGPTGHTSKWLTPTPVSIADATGASIFDPDDSFMSSMTATISGGPFAGDVLAFTVPGGSGISASYNASQRRLDRHRRRHGRQLPAPVAVDHLQQHRRRSGAAQQGHQRGRQRLVGPGRRHAGGAGLPQPGAPDGSGWGGPDELHDELEQYRRGQRHRLARRGGRRRRRRQDGLDDGHAHDAAHRRRAGFHAGGRHHRQLQLGQRRAERQWHGVQDFVSGPAAVDHLQQHRRHSAGGHQGDQHQGRRSQRRPGHDLDLDDHDRRRRRKLHDRGPQDFLQPVELGRHDRRQQCRDQLLLRQPGHRDRQDGLSARRSQGRGVQRHQLHARHQRHHHRSVLDGWSACVDHRRRLRVQDRHQQHAVQLGRGSGAQLRWPSASGFGGNDRVEITWTSGSIKNKWLEVQVLNTAHTGLACDRRVLLRQQVCRHRHRHARQQQLHYQYHRRVAGIRQPDRCWCGNDHQTRDFNRDKTVNTTDASLVFANLAGHLNRLLVGSAGPFAPDGGDLSGGGGGDAGISSALSGGGGGSTSTSTTQALPTAVDDRLAGGGGGGGSAAIDAALASSLADDDADQDDGADEMDELLDSLAAGA